MKQQILNLKKKLLLVELPEDNRENKLEFDNNISIGYKYLVYPSKYGCTKVPVSKDLELKKIGKLTDIKEEQFADRDIVEYSFGSAKESFFSYLESQGVVFENKLGLKPAINYGDYEFGNEGASDSMLESIEADMDSRFEQWQEAESKVWDISRCYLFEIL